MWLEPSSWRFFHHILFDLFKVRVDRCKLPFFSYHPMTDPWDWCISVTFVLKISKMCANIPDMDPMGMPNLPFLESVLFGIRYSKHRFHQILAHFLMANTALFGYTSNGGVVRMWIFIILTDLKSKYCDTSPSGLRKDNQQLGACLFFHAGNLVGYEARKKGQKVEISEHSAYACKICPSNQQMYIYINYSYICIYIYMFNFV